MASSIETLGEKKDCLIGVLVDVSGSMKNTFELGFSTAKSQDIVKALLPYKADDSPPSDHRSLAADQKSIVPENENIRKIHYILCVLLNIVNEKNEARNQNDRMFVGAFGLKKVHTCDLISLLEYISKVIPPNGYRDSEGERFLLREASEYELKSAREDKTGLLATGRIGITGHTNLIALAEKHGLHHAKDWIKICLTEPEAGVLCTVLSNAENLTKLFVEMLNSEAVLKLSGTSQFVSKENIRANARKVGLYRFLVQVIHLYAKVTAHLQKELIDKKPLLMTPQPIAKVSDILDKQLQKKKETRHGRDTKRVSIPFGIPVAAAFIPSVNEKLKEKKAATEKLMDQKIDVWSNLFECIEPIVYGRTPMVECMKCAKDTFNCIGSETDKILFILSDGESTDGDPVPVGKQLLDSGVTIVTCFLTAQDIPNPECLIDKKNRRMTKGAAALFDISSTIKNYKAPVSYLLDAGWVLPDSGESRLFLQANSMEVVAKFCKTIFSSVKNDTYIDLLTDFIGTIELADYINSSISAFEAKRQDGPTCYANAIAAVYHLAMKRIVGRVGGVPSFDIIRKRIIDANGLKPASTREVLEKTHHEYRLHYYKLENENDARHAINRRHPVVVTFRWSESQSSKFKKFFNDEHTCKGILDAADIKGLVFPNTHTHTHTRTHTHTHTHTHTNTHTHTKQTCCCLLMVMPIH